MKKTIAALLLAASATTGLAQKVEDTVAPKTAAPHEEAQKNRAEAMKAMQEFGAAGLKKDVATMEKAFNKLKELDPANPNLSGLNIQILVAKGDWAAVESGLKALEPGPSRRLLSILAAQRSAPDPKAPEAFKKSITAEVEKLVEDKGQPYEFQLLAGAHWDQGNRDAALVAAKRAADTAKELGQTNTNIPIEPYVRFAEAVERGEMPTVEQVNEWVREAMRIRSLPR